MHHTLCPPDHDCARCPRLYDLRATNAEKWPQWHNRPVDSFGPLSAKLLVVGLAPGLKGANRTGRPFTGDYAGEVLYPALIKYGFGTGEYAPTTNNSIHFHNARITNAVRCLPPANKPTTEEISACRSFLLNEINSMTQLGILLTLGRIAHETVLKTFHHKLKDYPFKHGAWHVLTNNLLLVNSYHCSRYNINTGRLTYDMFDEVIKAISFHRGDGPHN